MNENNRYQSSKENSQIDNRNNNDIENNNSGYSAQKENTPQKRGGGKWSQAGKGNALKNAFGKGSNTGGQGTSGKASEGNKNPTGKSNNGRKLLDGMKKNAKPDNKKAADNQKKLDRAAKLAQKAPLPPQVKAAATVANKLKNTKIGKAISSKFLGGGGGSLLGGEEGGPEQIVIAAMKRKIIMFSLPILFILLLIVMLVSVLSSSTTSASTTRYSNGLCAYDKEFLKEQGIKEQNIKNCGKVKKEVKDFYKRLKEVSDRYKENGQEFEPIYVVAFFEILSAEDVADLHYDDMTTEVIELLADSMLKDGTFDEETYKSKLEKEILPAFIDNKNTKYYKKLVKRIFKFVEDFKKLFKLDQDDGDGCIGPVTKLTKEQLCKLHGQGKYKEWVEKFGPVAQQDYARTGVFASVTMAQAMIEAAWGCAGIGDNLFGIKCNTPALKKKYKCRLEWTHDGAHGEIYHQVSFFVANGFADGLNLHSQFLKLNQRYAKAGVFSAKNGKEQVVALKKAGYAEDSEYVTKLTGQIDKYNLSKFDKKVNTPNDASCTSSIDASGGWSIRTVKPTSKDKAFTYKNSNRGQCVWYAQARAIEIAEDLAKKGKITKEEATKIRKKLLSIYGDGGQWYHAAKGIFKTSNKVKNVKAGSIISWTSGQWGHVAVVESVTDKQVIITEGWADNVQSCPNSWGCINFRHKTMSKSEFVNSYAKYYTGTYKFSGYIYFLEPES